MRNVYVVEALRTPLGKKGGVLSGLRPDDLAATVISALAAGLAARTSEFSIDDVYWGAANQAGEDNRNVARMAVLLAGLPTTVPGATVNRLCASGLDAIVSAARAIAAGEADLCIAGGSESMSRAPYVVARDSASDDSPELIDTRLGWRLVNPTFGTPLSLGETAEEVAERWSVSRTDQDEFALRSHRLAAAARDEGDFEDELLPVASATADEGIRDNTSLAALSALKPVFRTGGTVTAGNSSQISDGAAGVVLASEAMVSSLGLRPMVRYVGSAAAGVDPDVMGIGPVPATRRALERYGWSLPSVDLIELNEAYASQSLAVIRELGLPLDAVNVSGGAIALGHPLGCSGARLVVTLAHGMRRLGVARGLATMCVGVGQGMTALFSLSP